MEVQNVFIELTLVVQLSTLNIIRRKKKKKKEEDSEAEI